ncbi:hypothetical protein N9C35_02030 [Flavobacteriaceae bacterium]|nr:hypothetical protein [Flavobacteriaceae bacterium]
MFQFKDIACSNTASPNMEPLEIINLEEVDAIVNSLEKEFKNHAYFSGLEDESKKEEELENMEIRHKNFKEGLEFT